MTGRHTEPVNVIGTDEWWKAHVHRTRTAAITVAIALVVVSATAIAVTVPLIIQAVTR